MLIRKATEDFKIPNTKMKIDKGIQVLICNHLFQNDSEYFSEPKKFDPERFAKENKESRHQLLRFNEYSEKSIGNR
jgi:cytochrome P450 family 6